MRAWPLLAWLAAAVCNAAAPCPSPGADPEWAAGCFTTAHGARQLKPEYRHHLRFDHSGHALLRLADSMELVALDRRGVVVVPGIFVAGDFDYPRPEGGLVRFRDGARCGYFDPHSFQIRIPARYDQCMSFQHGSTSVCLDCALYCTEPECQDSMFIGGQALALDGEGRVLRRFTPPPLEQACHGKAPAQVERYGRGRAYLRCAPAGATPARPR